METLDSSMTFGFLVSVHALNLCFTIGWFGCFFFYLPIEWKKVTKRFSTVRLGVGG